MATQATQAPIQANFGPMVLMNDPIVPRRVAFPIPNSRISSGTDQSRRKTTHATRKVPPPFEAATAREAPDVPGADRHAEHGQEHSPAGCEYLGSGGHGARLLVGGGWKYRQHYRVAGPGAPVMVCLREPGWPWIRAPEHRGRRGAGLVVMGRPAFRCGNGQGIPHRARRGLRHRGGRRAPRAEERRAQR